MPNNIDRDEDANPATDPDEDGDGLPDAFESTLIDNDHDCLVAMFDVDDNDVCVPLASAACAPGDSDHDGISDIDEGELESRANDPDSDDDGLWDTWEIRDTRGLAAAAVDVDNDTVPNWLDGDSDCDGIADRLEGRLNAFGADAAPRAYLTRPLIGLAGEGLCAVIVDPL